MLFHIRTCWHDLSWIALRLFNYKNIKSFQHDQQLHYSFRYVKIVISRVVVCLGSHDSGPSIGQLTVLVPFQRWVVQPECNSLKIVPTCSDAKQQWHCVWVGDQAVYASAFHRTRVRVPIGARICITDEPKRGRICAVRCSPMVIVTVECRIQTWKCSQSWVVLNYENTKSLQHHEQLYVYIYNYGRVHAFSQWLSDEVAVLWA